LTVSGNGNLEKKKTTLFVVLSGIFLTNALLAEIIGVKIFSAEQTLGMNPAQIHLFDDFILDFNLTAGVVIWPVVFIITDITNEYFGKKGVRKMSFLTAGFIAYAFFVIYVVTILPPSPLWLDLNDQDASGNTFNINYAFQVIFRQGLGIIIGSLVAFLIAQLLDVFVFQRLRAITGSRMIWLRATGSTLISQFIDSFVVLGIAFHVFGNWSLKEVVALGIINYMYKFVVAIIITPFIYLGHYFIDRYLGKEYADEMANEAGKDRRLF
jgi:uncharacterized integral membrane protein (TIGR00697 family)